MEEARQDEAHRYFSTTLFNQTWDLLDLKERSAVQEEAMILKAFASYYHWLERPDVNAEKRSIACWQISRVWAVLENGLEAQRWARRSIDEAQDAADPFFLGYGFEALARAANLIGDESLRVSALEVAKELSKEVPDKASREALLADLETI